MLLRLKRRPGRSLASETGPSVRFDPAQHIGKQKSTNEQQWKRVHD